jgi:hypothetical protein
MTVFSFGGAKFYRFSGKLDKTLRFIKRCRKKLSKNRKQKPAKPAARTFPAAQTARNAGVSRLM